MRTALRTVSCRKVQIGSIKRRKVASLRRATEQISGNSPLFYRLNAIMLFLYATLWKDKLSFAPFYRYCRSVLLFALLLTVLFSQKQQQTQLYAAPNVNTSIYYGLHTPPWYPDWSGIPQLETLTGKKVSIIMGYTEWTDGGDRKNFNVSWFDQIRAHGSIPMLTWQPFVSLQTISNGNYDAYITKWAQDSKAWGHPYFLRYAHEMNGDWYPWSERVNNSKPGDYVKAWKHVHDIFTANGVHNVTWVWCPNTDYPGATPLAGLYPGDTYVDWTCIDGYNHGGETFSQVFKQTYDELLQIAPTKPIMIGETNSAEDGNKPQWVTDALSVQLPQNFPNIKALVWYNFSGYKGMVINSSQAALDAFKAGIASPYYASNAFGNITDSPIQPISDSSPLPPTVTAPSSGSQTTPSYASYDTSSTLTQTHGTTASWSHTTTTNANRLLIVGISTGGSNQTITSLTYNGISLTKITSVTPGNSIDSEMWYLKNPPSGTHSIAVTITGGATNIWGGASTYYNVDQTTPLGTSATNTGTGTSSSVSVTSSTSQIIADTLATVTCASATVGGGQMQGWISSNTCDAGSHKAGAASSTSLSWRWGVNTGWSEIAVPINSS
jgi:Glycosyl hydrolase family 26